MSTAHADTTYRHGSLCAPKHTSRDLVGVDERGIYNASASATATVTCPVIDRVAHQVYESDGTQGTWRHDTSGLRSIGVFYRDLSATSAFSCYPFWTASDGFSSWGPRRYTCVTPGGCTDATTEYTGANLLGWIVEDTAIPAHYHVGVVCSVPPATSTGSSYVKVTRTIDRTSAYEYPTDSSSTAPFSIVWWPQ